MYNSFINKIKTILYLYFINLKLKIEFRCYEKQTKIVYQSAQNNNKKKNKKKRLVF
jgi:hypothetical protein